MPTFYDSHGQSYVLTSQIGRGGEGAVFVCPNDAGLVAKIYHEPIDDEKAEKLKWMAENQNDQLLKVAAWIVDTLHDEPGGKVVGFLMPNVRAKEIHELYSLKSRRVHFPEATWQFLIHAATNVARAFYSLHKNGHIMGDVNHGNCVVLKDGTVKLIDCDSYSISRGEFRYRCEVGVATHLAPELQGKDLSAVERQTAHDNFGLAVIIFQLLFLGRHPFAGNYLGSEDKSLEDCIREHRFAYGERAVTRSVKQPPGTLSLTAIPERLATMFERAFLTLKRPEPREWIEALEDLSDSLKQCALHMGHFYYRDLSACPWCALETQTGLMLFPFVSGARAGANGESFNIFTIENLVASLAVPHNLPAKPPKTSVLPPPSPEAENARRENLSRFVTLSVLQFCIVIFLTAIAGPGVGFFIGALLMAGFIFTLNNSGKNSKVDMEVRLEKARQEWNQLETEWSGADILPQFNTDVALIRQKINEHHQLQQQSREKVKLLHDEVYRYKLEVYLSSFKIGDAKIAGASNKKLELLKGFNIRSAADADGNRLGALPPAYNEIKEKVLEWRKNLERDFVYDPDADVPETEQNRLTTRFTEKRGNIEREIENLLVSLRSGSTLVRQRQQHLQTRAEAIGRQLLQSESDLAATGSVTPAIVVLILITTLIPMFGNAFSSAKPYRSVLRESDSGVKIKAPPVTNPSISGATSPNSAPSANEVLYKYDYPETMSEKDIALLDESEKTQFARELLDRATKLAGNAKPDYKLAEQRLKLAHKLDAKNVKVLNKLGDVLYEQQKYKESLEYLNRALQIEPNNTDTKFAVGMDYLQMNYYDDAHKIFLGIVTRNPKWFEANFNLGQALKGLKDYEAAAQFFRAATEIKPGDSDAIYQHAWCLYKTGSTDAALREYQRLSEINPKKGENLRKELGLKNIPPSPMETKAKTTGGSGYGDGSGSGRGAGSSTYP
ncbi:MAG TPA: tetratricopeptide repeat protein [Pyrinomonadaceae bacterium]|jgi:DNA-binding helix-hairpin-helix protein with protein kinase domain/Tfp pilus assembly protein PilF